MHELGESSQLDHQAIINFAQELEIDHVVAVATPDYGNGGVGSNSLVHHVNSFDEALDISTEITSGDVILIKGSRAEGLEKLSDYLKESLSMRESTEEEREKR